MRVEITYRFAREGGEALYLHSRVSTPLPPEGDREELEECEANACAERLREWCFERLAPFRRFRRIAAGAFALRLTEPSEPTYSVAPVNVSQLATEAIGRLQAIADALPRDCVATVKPRRHVGEWRGARIERDSALVTITICGETFSREYAL